MRRAALALALVLAGGAAPGLANAQTAPAAAAATEADVRCALVSLFMLGRAEEKERASFALVAFYYLGRLDGRAPGLDLEAQLRAAAEEMTPDAFAKEGARCGDELAKRGKEVEAVGERLQTAPKS